ncbi:hypothetical protein ACETU7_06135 [Rhodococcus sp. 3Y1]
MSAAAGSKLSAAASKFSRRQGPETFVVHRIDSYAVDQSFGRDRAGW